MCGKIFNGHIYKNLLLSLPVKKLVKSVNVWQNCKQEGGLHVDDHEQKQFPMMLMTHIGFAFPELFFSFPGIGMCKRYFWDSRA